MNSGNSSGAPSLLWKVGDYAGIPGMLGYPCSSDLSEQTVREALALLRNNPAIVPTLRLRIINLDTRIYNLNACYQLRVSGLRELAEEKP